MNKGIFGLGLGSAAVAMLAILGMAAPSTAHAGVCSGMAGPDFGDGGAQLQGVFNGMTTNPNPGVSSINVTTDCLPDGSEKHWSIDGSGGTVSSIIAEIAGFAPQNIFGIYDATDSSKLVQLFAGAAVPGNQVLASILIDGSVEVGGVDSGVDFAGNVFGYYLTSPQGTFYSDTSLNSDGVDHMYAYQGNNIDDVMVPGRFPGLFTDNEHVFAWEDLLGGGDKDYADFVVIVESVTRVPEPSSLAIVGLGLLGLGAVSRRRKRVIA